VYNVVKDDHTGKNSDSGAFQSAKNANNEYIKTYFCRCLLSAFELNVSLDVSDSFSMEVFSFFGDQ
jgi:hypothetical protein